MFSNIFSTSAPVDPKSPNFHSVTTKLSEGSLFGELEPKDTEWLCSGGFVTETQTFYTVTEDGQFLNCQVIHSSVGVWFPTIQFTCKLYNPKTGATAWKSLNVNNFVTPPPGHDKRSSKADEFSVIFKSKPGSDYPESYTINANLGVDLQVAIELSRPASVPGYKVGTGPQGGYSYFGHDPAKADGYVIHRFWPRFIASGHIIQKGVAEAIKGSGMFVHAIQGMRPNLVASAWNFNFFQSNQLEGVSAIQMEFTTLDTHGKKGPGSGPVVVNIGSLVVGNKLVAISAETKWPGEGPLTDLISRTTHLNSVLDADTSYPKPSKILVEWKAPSIIPDAKGNVEAKLEVDVGSLEHPKGLLEKVDILGEIPSVIKMAVSYVAGTKPFMYQWLNPTKLSIKGPDGLVSGLSSGVDVEGTLYTEATFISS